MGCGEERRAVGKTGLDLLPYIPTRPEEPQGRSPAPLRASAAPRQILLTLRVNRVGKRKGLTRKFDPLGGLRLDI